MLKRGMTGPEVVKAQEALKGLGIYQGAVDGDFGPKMEAAVQEWERRRYVSGTLDDQEMAALVAEYGRTISTSPIVVTPAGAQINVAARPSIPHGIDELVRRYGRPWDDADAWAKQWLAPVRLPDGLTHLVKRGEVWVNRECVDDLSFIFHAIVDRGLAAAVRTFDGCWNIRKIRGTTDKWSTHSWAIAVDLNAATNQLGTPGDMNQTVVAIFKERGWTWGGDYRRSDPMHFQRATGV